MSLLHRTRTVVPPLTNVWPSDAGHEGSAEEVGVVLAPVAVDTEVEVPEILLVDPVEGEVFENAEDEEEITMDVPEVLVRVLVGTDVFGDCEEDVTLDDNVETEELEDGLIVVLAVREAPVDEPVDSALLEYWEVVMVSDVPGVLITVEDAEEGVKFGTR